MQPDWWVIWFGRCGEYRTEADIIGSLFLRCDGLLETVRGFSNADRTAHELADICDGRITLADVHSLQRHGASDFGVIVNYERHVARRRKLVQLASNRDQFIGTVLFAAKLDEIDAALDHGAG